MPTFYWIYPVLCVLWAIHNWTKKDPVDAYRFSLLNLAIHFTACLFVRNWNFLAVVSLMVSVHATGLYVAMLKKISESDQ